MGSGFRTWTTGEVVTASNVNNYLQEQTVMSFASVAARDAAITAPEEGMLCVLRDVDTLSLYTASAWRTQAHYGAWTTYTPIWSADSGTTTLGNGTLDGRHALYGGVVFFTIRFQWGSSTSQSVGGANWRFNLPTDAYDGLSTTFGTASAWILDTSAGTRWSGNGYVGSGAAPAQVNTIMTDQGAGIVGDDIPMAWANGDRLHLYGFFERAV